MVLTRFARNRLGKILQLAEVCRNRLNRSKLPALNWIARAINAPFEVGKTANTEVAKRFRVFLGNCRLLFSSDEIPELDEGNFIDYLRRHKTVFVMWYDPLCPVCRKSRPHFERLYEEMKGSIGFGTINAAANQDLAISQDIKAFPTFRLYRCNGKCSYKHHEGMLDYSQMKSFVSCTATKLQSLNNFIIQRSRGYSPCKQALSIDKITLNIVAKSGMSTIPCRHITCSPLTQTISNLPKNIKVGNTKLFVNQNTMEVTGNNFNEKIKAFESVLVYFYTTWCVHCGLSLGEFLKAADLVEDTVGTLAICNAEESLEIVDKYYVGKIPTLKFFRKGRYGIPLNYNSIPNFC